MAYSNFLHRREGSIGVMAAAMLGAVSMAVVGAVDYAMAVQARQKAQHALDAAAISASRVVVARRDGERQGGGSLGQDVQDRGEDAFDMSFDNDRIADRRLRFDHADDRIDASADIRYEPLLSNLMGPLDFEITSQVSINPARAQSGAVCFSALSGNVDIASGAVDASDCAISATGAIDPAAGNGAKLTCGDGDCAHDDPFEDMAEDFVGGRIRSQGCQGEFGASSGIRTTSYSGVIKFCTHVTIGANHTFNLSGGTFLFEQGLTVEASGKVDSTGGGGSTIVIGAGASLNVMPGATFMVAPPASGTFAGISIAAVEGFTVPSSSISAASPGYVMLNGVVYMPGHDLLLRGPDAVEMRDGDLAIWADRIGLSDNALVPGSPTTEGPGLPSISLQTSAPKTRLSR